MEDLQSLFITQLKDKATRETAFRKLMADYKERLYWHIRNIVKSHDDADDVLQNTFIKIYRYIDKFKGDSKLYTWMYRIATNEALTFLSKQAKRKSITDEELQTSLIENLESDVYFEGDEIAKKLQEAIATLPEKQRLVFNMRYFEELKYSDISEITETSEGSLKASYHLASKKIEEYLKTN
ncbi:RNA polymerase sigma factor [Croceibacter atlanticus]|uniref:RNA polymerase sigma factor n=1 Tax=Croceibacter atlanticus TaxID=313588 RepID=UPI0024B977B6|nr:RNA polymerase sigma factor [Croceibacter atlanticus]